MIQWVIMAPPFETVKQLSVLTPITKVPSSSIREYGGVMNKKNENQKFMLVIFSIWAITSLPPHFLIFGTRKASFPRNVFLDFLHRDADILVAFL